MPSPKKDLEREERITMEIVVDTYGPEEQAMGWYCYLEDHLAFPFEAKCIAARRTSVVRVGKKVQVVGMAEAEECEQEMFVEIIWDGDQLVIPLAQIIPIHVDETTQQAVEDWHYWLARGYQFG